MHAKKVSNIFSGSSLIACSKWSLIHFQIVRKINFDPFLMIDTMIGPKVERTVLQYIIFRKWINVHFASLLNMWYGLFYILYWIKVHAPGTWWSKNECRSIKELLFSTIVRILIHFRISKIRFFMLILFLSSTYITQNASSTYSFHFHLFLLLNYLYFRM